MPHPGDTFIMTDGVLASGAWCPAGKNAFLFPFTNNTVVYETARSHGHVARKGTHACTRADICLRRTAISRLHGAPRTPFALA